MPYTLPNYQHLLYARCLISMFMGPCIAHPLVPDYIYKKSIGRAIALSVIGYIFGDLVAISDFLHLTKSMPCKNAFCANSIFFFVMTF